MVLGVTGGHSVYLALPMPTAVDNRFTHLDSSATVDPLFARNGNARECGEEGNGQTGVTDGPNADGSGITASPLRERGIVTGWDVPDRGPCGGREELITHLLVIRLRASLDVDNESGCDRGEQTNLLLQENQVNTTVKMDAKKKKVLTEIDAVFKNPPYFS